MGVSDKIHSEYCGKEKQQSNFVLTFKSKKRTWPKVLLSAARGKKSGLKFGRRESLQDKLTSYVQTIRLSSSSFKHPYRQTVGVKSGYTLHKYILSCEKTLDICTVRILLSSLAGSRN